MSNPFSIGRRKKNSVQTVKAELNAFIIIFCDGLWLLFIYSWISQQVFWYIIMTLRVHCSLEYVLFYFVLEDKG